MPGASETWAAARSTHSCHASQIWWTLLCTPATSRSSGSWHVEQDTDPRPTCPTDSPAEETCWDSQAEENGWHRSRPTWAFTTWHHRAADKEKKGFGETRKENEILQKLGQSRPQIDMKLTEGNKSIMNDLNTACNGLGLVLPMHPILQSYVQKIHVILMWIRNVHVSQKGFWTQHMFIIELSDHEH